MTVDAFKGTTFGVNSQIGNGQCALVVGYQIASTTLQKLKFEVYALEASLTPFTMWSMMKEVMSALKASRTQR